MVDDSDFSVGLFPQVLRTMDGFLANIKSSTDRVLPPDGTVHEVTSNVCSLSEYLRAGEKTRTIFFPSGARSRYLGSWGAPHGKNDRVELVFFPQVAHVSCLISWKHAPLAKTILSRLFGGGLFIRLFSSLFWKDLLCPCCQREFSLVNKVRWDVFADDRFSVQFSGLPCLVRLVITPGNYFTIVVLEIRLQSGFYVLQT